MISAAIAIAAMYWAEYTKGRGFLITGVFVVLILFMIIDIFRLELKKGVPLFSFLEREKENNRMIAITYAAIAVMIMLSIYRFEIAMTALAMGFFGDATSALVGIRWGKKKLMGKKTLEGSLANFFTCLLVGFLFLENIFLIFCMALTATVVELLIHKLEDNFYVPIFTGLVGQLLLLFW